MTENKLFGSSEQLDDTISRQAAIDVLRNRWLKTRNYEGIGEDIAEECEIYLKTLPSAQPDIEKICTRIKAEAIKRNVEYMKHGDRYMLGFVDGMRLARRIVDGTIDDPVYFTTSGD